MGGCDWEMGKVEMWGRLIGGQGGKVKKGEGWKRGRVKKGGGWKEGEGRKSGGWLKNE